MNTVLFVGIPIFLIVLFLFWKFTNQPIKEEYGEKMWKQGASRLSFWQFGIYASMGVTALVLFVLKWTEVVTF